MTELSSETALYDMLHSSSVSPVVLVAPLLAVLHPLVFDGDVLILKLTHTTIDFHFVFDTRSNKMGINGIR